MNVRSKSLVIPILLGVLSSMSTAAFGASTAAKAAEPSAARAPAHATFALGCFWCGEATFEGREGVISVTSGYTGGTKKNPTYEEVGTGTTGHYESIDVVFDPKHTSYDKLLDIFWHNVDPTQADGQFCDRGPEYRSVIFYHGDEQHRLALETEKQIQASGRLKKPIVTQIVPASTFYPAEEYHQDYATLHPDDLYIRMNDAPKVEALKRGLPDLYVAKKAGS